MSLPLGTVREDQTLNIIYTTAAADGGEENFSATLEQADFTIYKDGSAMTLDASTITPSNIATGVQKVVVDLSNDADFTLGAFYQLILDASDETIDTQPVSGQIAHWYIESADEQAARKFREDLLGLGSAVSTTTNNTQNSVNLTDIVHANSTLVQGEILAWTNAGNELRFMRVTNFTYPQATVEMLDGSQLPEAVASGDRLVRVGQYTAKTGGLDEIANQTSLDGVGDNTSTLLTRLPSVVPFSTAGNVQADVQEMNETTVLGTGTPGDKWRGS